jgi:DNA-binding GntR family transcriptional regulator
MASKLGISRCSVARAIGKLVEHGYLERESGDSTRSNRYRAGKPTEYIKMLEERRETHLTRIANLLAEAA